jgi:CRP-like cAMP-binding protein/tRNA A-37 threonylcarbamoyl transferase component Bud32
MLVAVGLRRKESQKSEESQKRSLTLKDLQRGGGSLARRESSKFFNLSSFGDSLVGNVMCHMASEPLSQDDLLHYVPPTYPKTDDDVEFITIALQRNFVFANALSDEAMSRKREFKLIVDAFESYSVRDAGITILSANAVGDYFYILKSGCVEYRTVDPNTGRKVIVGRAIRPGQSFGELCLLYNCPPPADCVSGPPGEGTVRCENERSCELWRIDKIAFRHIIALRTMRQDEWLRDAVRKIEAFRGLDDEFINRISNSFDVRPVKRGEVIYRTGDDSEEFYIVGSEGRVMISENKGSIAGGASRIIRSGGAFGVEAFEGVDGYQRVETAIAERSTTLLVMSREQLDRTIGSLKDAKLVSRDRELLKSIPLFRDSDIEDFEYELMAALIEPHTYKGGKVIYEEEDNIDDPALLIVRNGALEVSGMLSDQERILTEGEFFWENSLLPDKNGKFAGGKGGTKYREETVEVISNEALCGKLTLSNIDSVILDLHRLGCNRTRNRRMPNSVGLAASMVKDESPPKTLEDLEYHQLFGAGTFGRVWIVSRRGSSKTGYALKIQSKRALLDQRQASSALRERMVMAQLNHPFVCKLINTFQDDACIYMLLSFIQGGELLNLIQGGEQYGGLPEIATKFYSAMILEGLTYMHRRHIIYRDLKPENVLLDSHGYTVIVDFGFAKKVTDKTYTFCGTPLYLAPEIVLSRGHDRAVDYWSLGCLIFEMLYCTTPFYESGMDQKRLFRKIAQAKWKLPDDGKKLSKYSVDLLHGMLQKRPNERLGGYQFTFVSCTIHSCFVKSLLTLYS